MWVGWKDPATEEESIQPTRALPDGFKQRFSDADKGWFPLLRVCFREELKDNDKARIAFELDCQSLIPQMLGKSFCCCDESRNVKRRGSPYCKRQKQFSRRTWQEHSSTPLYTRLYF
jgi:hypothetical protein